MNTCFRWKARRWSKAIENFTCETIESTMYPHLDTGAVHPVRRDSPHQWDGTWATFKPIPPCEMGFTVTIPRGGEGGVLGWGFSCRESCQDDTKDRQAGKNLVAIHTTTFGAVTERLFPLFGEHISGPSDLHGCKRKMSKMESLAGNEPFHHSTASRSTTFSHLSTLTHSFCCLSILLGVYTRLCCCPVWLAHGALRKYQ